jgi:hypothetical protein
LCFIGIFSCTRGIFPARADGRLCFLKKGAFFVCVDRPACAGCFVDGNNKCFKAVKEALKKI